MKKVYADACKTFREHNLLQLARLVELLHLSAENNLWIEEANLFFKSDDPRYPLDKETGLRAYCLGGRQQHSVIDHLASFAKELPQSLQTAPLRELNDSEVTQSFIDMLEGRGVVNVLPPTSDSIH